MPVYRRGCCARRSIVWTYVSRYHYVDDFTRGLPYSFVIRYKCAYISPPRFVMINDLSIDICSLHCLSLHIDLAGPRLCDSRVFSERNIAHVSIDKILPGCNFSPAPYLGARLGARYRECCIGNRDHRKRTRRAMITGVMITIMVITNVAVVCFTTR